MERHEVRVLLFDIGATNTRLAMAHGERMDAAVHMPTDPGSGGFERLIGQMQAVAGNERLTAIVGGMRSQREGSEGRLVLDTGLKAWLGIPVRARLEQVFGCPVRIENDAVMGGIGEAQFGAGSTKGVMAYVTVSSGVNFVRLVDGAPDATIERFELGRQLVGDLDGQAVSLEELTGGLSMSEHYGRPPATVHGERVWRLEAAELARGLYNMMLYWAPQVIVFGGSMMRDIDLAEVRTELGRWPVVWTHEVKLVRAKLGDEVGLRGALWVATHKL